METTRRDDHEAKSDATMKKKALEIRREILAQNYWEHVKYEKDMAFVLKADHPLRLSLRNLSNNLSVQLHHLES